MAGIKKRLGSLRGPQGIKGDQGDQGLPGPNAVPADEAVSAYVTNSGSLTKESLDRSYIPNSVLRLAPNPPAGFRGLSVLPTPTIRRTMAAEFLADLNVHALRPATGVTYYTAPGAPTNGSGLTPDDPLRMSIAAQRPDVGTLILADGEYDISETMSPTTGHAISMNWLAAPGANPVITSWARQDSLTWENAGDHIYRTSRSVCTGVFDTTNRTSWGDYTRYERKDSYAAIDGPGQWARGEGSELFVWALGDLNLATNNTHLRLQVAGRYGAYLTAGATMYLEGIEFHGCATGSGNRGGIVAIDHALIIAKDCAVRYNTNSSGIQTRGGHFIGINVEASSNERDGFGYHDVEGNGAEFIEINCHAHNNGLEEPGVNNATTSHEAVTGIRVGGIYEKTAGPVVADVNHAHTWNLGCYAGGYAVEVPNSNPHSWRVDGSGDNPPKMWLDECSSGEADYAYMTTGNGATIYVHASGYGNEHEAMAGSNIVNYERH